MFNPQRLTIARERRAMTKKGVAESVGLSTNTIHRYETGELKPSDENLKQISAALEFPLVFFENDDELDQPRLDNASFRGLSSKTDRIMKAALQSGTLAYRFDDWISERYNRVPLNLPEYPAEMKPKIAAKLLRQQWRLGDKPIENMVHLLEAKGIRVFSLAENNKEIDAYSVWRDDTPYIFLNRFKSAERSRFDAAHELCHLCLHKHGGATAEKKNSPIEKEAQAFAGEFLMPEADVRSIMNTAIYSVDDLLPYKRRWRVAAVALAYRLLELDILRKSQSNSFYVEMSRRGWLKGEPQTIAREQSNLWQQIFDDLRRSDITKAEISNQTGVPVWELEALLFGLANMITIDGRGERTAPRNPGLRLVS
ncbi:helix-turn-helix domain-containing protein [uncultured Sphingomonas sp.]|uniref:helix-turn-helix domain-containing protein n=1 Tax=uncultured Sphingomonas sp. TaxID=158754 RepID=UPI0035CAC071